MGHPPFILGAGALKKALVKAHLWGSQDRAFTNAARQNPPPIQACVSKVEDESPLQKQNHPNQRVGGMVHLTSAAHRLH